MVTKKLIALAGMIVCLGMAACCKKKCDNGNAKTMKHQSKKSHKNGKAAKGMKPGKAAKRMHHDEK